MEAARVAGSNFFVLTDIVDLEMWFLSLGGSGGPEGPLSLGSAVPFSSCTVYQRVCFSHHHWQTSMVV